MNITLLRESFALVTERSPQVVTRFYEIHEEATPSLRRGFGRGDELQRDLSIERRIATEIDVPHASLPEDAVDHESVEGGGRASPLDGAVLRLRGDPGHSRKRTAIGLRTPRDLRRTRTRSRVRFSRARQSSLGPGA